MEWQEKKIKWFLSPLPFAPCIILLLKVQYSSALDVSL